jgi:DNA helicase-2/ATP-dependent DNA helicase PcrA
MSSVILGPPGTGKTTAILNLIEEELKNGTAPDRIGYFAFTKKASEEGKIRTIDRFSMTASDIPHFRTLHSLCYKMLGLTREAVMGKQHYKDFNDLMGMRLTGDLKLEEGSITVLSKDDKLKFVEGLSRLRCVPLREQYHHHHDDDIDWYRLDRYARGLFKFKQTRSVYDFTDMLELCVEKELSPKLEAVFIDEAQDLSPLQWKLVNLITSKADRVYIAGDDDQAIFTWAGADVDHLVNLSKDATVLNKSYRLPKSVYEVANKVISRVSNRTEKKWEPKEEQGSVISQASFEHVNLTQGEWLILSRSNYLLNEIEAHCLGLGVFFERKDRSSISHKKINAVRNWEQLRKGELIFPDQAQEIMSYIKGSKAKKFDTYEPSAKLTLKQVVDVGELSEPEIWHDMFTNLSAHERSYILALLRAGEKITKTPRIKLSTIHSAKGGEADNVLLLTDIPTKTWKKYEKNSDDETRVFYVGLTRAKKTLHIVQPKTNKYFMI